MTAPGDSDGVAGGVRVLIVGTGLIGTSIGLGLVRRGVEVWLDDPDPQALHTACGRGAGTELPRDAVPDVIFVAVPPHVTASVVSASLDHYLNATVSDVASVKSQVVREISTHDTHGGRFVPGHPMAGREVSGPGAAMADLFEGRVWALTPSAATDAFRVDQVAELVRLLGAVPVFTTAQAHDVAVALTSHTPQIVSSVVAAGLVPLPDSDVQISGQGLRDVARLASSDPDLWTDILSANADPVADALDDLISRLGTVRDGLRSGAAGQPAVRAALAAGVSGVAKIPGKHGTSPVAWASVAVVIADRPGELGRLFLAAGESGINLEDVRIDHAAGRPTGLVELSVRPDMAEELVRALSVGGWNVRGSRSS